ncbi:hypothetical protein KFE25_001574 [Diacronema lutheri]|uniref:Uncharacterized protein n=1 Tax=Diacronema lutheri TaxID=2081491 RepID=A0A8J5XCQ6_DIALT|nr:hypothetical protein KFE25_001574 [Diacronema lutheri]
MAAPMTFARPSRRSAGGLRGARRLAAFAALGALGAPPTANVFANARAADVAVVYVAMGRAVREAVFVYSVRNLRLRGGYSGDIYVVTDKPACVPRGARVIYSPPSTAPEVQGTGHPLPQPHRVPAEDVSRSITRISYYKSHKMRLLQLLPAKVMYALYLDIDVVAAAPITQLLAERHRLDPPRARRDGVAAGSAARTAHPDLLMFREVRYRSGRVGADERVVQTEPFHTGALLLRRGTSDGCLGAWLNVTVRNALRDPTKHVRDQAAFGEAVAAGACTPGELSVLYLRTVAVTRREDLRPLQHVTRTGLMVKKGLSDADWYAFGQVLLGINGTAAARVARQPTLLQRLATRLGAAPAAPDEPRGFRWWGARNPECVRVPRGSVDAQAIAAGWLPRTRGSPLVVVLVALLAAGALALALLFRWRQSLAHMRSSVAELGAHRQREAPPCPAAPGAADALCQREPEGDDASESLRLIATSRE